MTAAAYIPGQSAAQAHASLRRSLKAMNQAHQCSVLWFAEIMRRQLYRELGFSTINQYALRNLGFSKSRTGDFIRLARRLDQLPRVRKAMADGQVGYTKVREIVSVATPETEDQWLKAAKGTRRELIHEVKKAKRAALVERLHQLGGVPSDRAELMLEALAALVESKEKTPRGALGSRPPVQIHVHEYQEKMTVQTGSGERELSLAEAERLRCDAAVCRQKGRNTNTISPRVRREALARDRFRCQAAGCEGRGIIPAFDPS